MDALSDSDFCLGCSSGLSIISKDCYSTCWVLRFNCFLAVEDGEGGWRVALGTAEAARESSSSAIRSMRLLMANEEEDEKHGDFARYPSKALS